MIFCSTCSRKKVVQHCVGNAGSLAVWWRSNPMAVWFSEWIPGEDGAWLSQGSLQETWRTIEKACLKMWGKP